MPPCAGGECESPGRLGGQRGGHHRREGEQCDRPHDETEFGGERGGDDRDRRFGSRRGRGSRRGDRRGHHR
ncbi:hypothetical protein DMJ13_10045 [halophilic archaeon]|nr:hypothetical protein DMJ13_10045 [halophilic archaeon]